MITELFKSAIDRFHWLYVLLFLIFLLRCVLAVFGYSLLIFIGSTETGVSLWLGLLGSVLGIAGNWLLLRGKRVGLWLFLLMLACFTIMLGLSRFADWGYDVKVLVGVCSLYLIFFGLKKNGKTAWQTLE